jgi:hypothetical protein
MVGGSFALSTAENASMFKEPQPETTPQLPNGTLSTKQTLNGDSFLLDKIQTTLQAWLLMETLERLQSKAVSEHTYTFLEAYLLTTQLFRLGLG